jgi:hypothetical protein
MYLVAWLMKQPYTSRKNLKETVVDTKEKQRRRSGSEMHVIISWIITGYKVVFIRPV